MTNEFLPAFTAFMNEEFEDACVLSTEESWGGGSYSVELFKDGSYNTFPTLPTGNLYDSEGLIVGIPTLDEDELSDGIGGHCFDNAEEAMTDLFDEAAETYYSEVLAHAQ